MSRGRPSHRRCAAVLAGLAGIALAGAVAAQPILVVHLPSTPIEAAGRQAAAITALVDHFAGQADLGLETKVFRRAQDARDFLAGDGERVALLLADTSFLSDLPANDGWEAVARFSRGGDATYKRLLVVQAGRQDLAALSDLRGGSLSVVETSGAAEQLDFVERAIFADVLDPASWFGAVDSAVDDFAAIVNVLYGETDAALVSEHNPLLEARLDKDLRVLYTSPPLSLPVLCRRRGQLSSVEDAALMAALRATGDVPEGREALASLGFDGFELLRPAPVEESLAVLTPAPGQGQKAFEIALPEPGAVVPEAPGPPSGELVELILSIELPEIPLTAFEPSEKL